MNLEAQQKWYNKEKRDYFNMYGYRISVFEVLWKNQVIRFLFIFLALFYFYLFFQRVKTSLKSGGSMLDPFHIAKGRFYIHNAYVFKKRIIPLNNIKKIEVDFIPSVKLNGARYFLCIEQKSGKALAYFFGQSKENDKLVRNLKNETKKYHIKVIIH